MIRGSWPPCKAIRVLLCGRLLLITQVLMSAESGFLVREQSSQVLTLVIASSPSSGVNWEWGNLGSLSRLESAGLGRVTFNTQCVSALCTLLTNQPVAVHIIGDVRSSAWSLSGQANS